MARAGFVKSPGDIPELAPGIEQRGYFFHTGFSITCTDHYSHGTGNIREPSSAELEYQKPWYDHLRQSVPGGGCSSAEFRFGCFVGGGYVELH
jgi:hypothetical protein